MQCAAVLEKYIPALKRLAKDKMLILVVLPSGEVPMAPTEWSELCYRTQQVKEIIKK